MLRIEVWEAGQGTLPAIDVDAPVVVIGRAADAQVRLPASAAEPQHVRIQDGRWHALGPVTLESAGAAAATNPGSGLAIDAGDVGDGITLAIGPYRVRIAPAPAGSLASAPQRTESLARELARSLLGSGAAPSLEVERGPVVGARKQLPPPGAVTVIGRGDEATWILLEEDLSRRHAEVQRGWDGTRIVDLGSKNGTRVDGVLVGPDGTLLHDGALVELGPVALRFRDPAEQALRQTPQTIVASIAASRARATPAAPAPVSPAPSVLPFYVAVAIMLAALAGLVWVLSV